MLLKLGNIEAKSMRIPVNITDFEIIRNNGYYYIDKTDFIRQWWENRDDVTLITPADVREISLDRICRSGRDF